MIKNKLSVYMGANRESMKELSEKVGITRTTLSNIYNERAGGIRFDTLEKICRHYNCGVGDMLQILDDQPEA